MARAALACAVLAVMLAFASADRGLFQAAKTECKSVKVANLGKTPPCVTQSVKINPKDPKSTAIKSPRSITDFIASADAACALLGKGEADPAKVQFGATATQCNNGKAVVKGVAWTTLYCCAPGTSLASWRDTRAFMGSDSFARQRDTLSYQGCSTGASEDVFGGYTPCEPTGH